MKMWENGDKLTSEKMRLIRSTITLNNQGNYSGNSSEKMMGLLYHIWRKGPTLNKSQTPVSINYTLYGKVSVFTFLEDIP